jgi:hypothetical protein
MKIKLNNRHNCILYLLLCLLLSACRNNSSLSPGEYLQFLNSGAGKLNESEVLNHIRFRCRLQTPEIITLLNGSKNYTRTEDFERDKQAYENQLNFVFVIEDENKSDHLIKETIFRQESYGQLLSYAHTELQNDFELELADGNSIPCSLIHIEPANSIHPVIRIALSFFNVNSKIKDYKLIFNDNMFNTGKIKFHFDKKAFDDLPQLKI